MVNITNAPSTTGASTPPSSSTLPDTLVGFQQSTTQYVYASPSGTTNDVNGGFPRFIGNIRLAVTLAAGNATWTGLGAGSDGQHCVLWNTDATSSLTLSVSDAGSLAPNQFNGVAGTSSLGPGTAAELVYYAGNVNAWVITLTASSGGGGGGTTLLVSGTVTAASTDNYNPGSGFPILTGYLNINPTTNDVILTGLVAGSNLQQVIIRNIGTTYQVFLSTGGTGSGDSNSSAANQFVGQGDAPLPPGASARLIYYTSPSPKWSISS